MATPSLDTTGEAPANDAQATIAPSVTSALPTCNEFDRVVGDGGSEEGHAILDEVRRIVLEDVDVKLGDKMKELWSRGNKMLKQIETENQQQAAKLLEELALRREKQDALKAEQEHLRTLLTSMVSQFSMLGAVFAGPSNPTPGTSTPTCCDVSSSSATGTPGTSTLQESLPELAAPVYVGSFPHLPAMPDFPFPPQDASSLASAATPLSLVEALGAEAPSASVPVSLMGSLSPTSPAEMDFGCPKIFSFTLRKADGTDLGINVSHHEHDKVLRVEGVRPEGAVEAWNRQCIGSAAAEKAVMPGDRIISVNLVTNEPAKMLEECRDKQLLKFTIMRGALPGVVCPPLTPVTVPVAKNTTLRADASEFVPGGFVTEQVTTEANVSLEGSPQEMEAAS